MSQSPMGQEWELSIRKRPGHSWRSLREFALGRELLEALWRTGPGLQGAPDVRSMTALDKAQQAMGPPGIVKSVFAEMTCRWRVICE